jgi:hypothetical protein
LEAALFSMIEIPLPLSAFFLLHHLVPFADHLADHLGHGVESKVVMELYLAWLCQEDEERERLSLPLLLPFWPPLKQPVQLLFLYPHLMVEHCRHHHHEHLEAVMEMGTWLHHETYQG